MSEIRFQEGIPERPIICGTNKSPEELIGKKCGGCVRCETREQVGGSGWHCTMLAYDKDIDPSDAACKEYWSKTEQRALDRLRDLDTEKRRKELWAIYSKREPVKLPIVNDGYGFIPQCPVCGEMTYSSEQCHWCGQRFLQDEEMAEYNGLETTELECPVCGCSMFVTVSKYNRHKSGHCKNCGASFME